MPYTGRIYVFCSEIFWSLVEEMPKRDEVTGEWRKLHNAELNDLYASPNIFRVIKSRKMRLTWHVARMGRGEVYTGFWWGNLRGRDDLEDLGVDEKTIWRWIFRKWDRGGGHGLDWSGSGKGRMAVNCKRGDEPSGSIKYEEFLD